jgi:hypothetical protein
MKPGQRGGQAVAWRLLGRPARRGCRPAWPDTRPVMLELVAEAKAQGLPEHRASQVLRISPRSLQRWRQPARPKVPAAPRPRPANALTREEASAVVSVIRSPAHADQSCRELALSLENAPEQAVSVSPVTIWRYQVALDCNGPRGR